VTGRDSESYNTKKEKKGENLILFSFITKLDRFGFCFLDTIRGARSNDCEHKHDADRWETVLFIVSDGACGEEEATRGEWWWFCGDGF